jgi:hypothetical protein
LTTALRVVAECCGELAAETTWYRFGSTSERATGRDVDLLVVYEHRDPKRANNLREAITSCAPPEPLDLLLLMPEEAAKFNFIESERCEQIWP